ncbi:MAG: tRNA 2-thiouridine(34) synthase MnmA [Halieaceae bacterium]|nr:tRNA 2-thiouridine(34) synthase MnmA [Halieaceae bacterium]
MNPKQKVIVGLSGGVDSSVAALCLLEQGYDVEALFMKNWDEDDDTEYCTAMQDFADASAVAAELGIVLHGANFAREYWDRVFEYFLAEYQAGRTPNPDILCNKEIKFKAFLDYALRLGADYIATGHYAQTGCNDAGLTTLRKGVDPSKDQSYFLHQVSHQALAKTLFPLGTMHKTEVRERAKAAGLPTFDKKDSTGICFIGERRFSDFLATYLPAQPGKIYAVTGEELGNHQGLMYHTIGQRQGLGIGGTKDFGDAPWYVVDKDLDNNRLMVAQGNQHPSLFKNRLTVVAPFWIGGPPGQEFHCSAKIRYRQLDQRCSVLCAGNTLSVEFDEPQRAITPGQSAVFYDGDRCLGGGVIAGAE